MKIDSEPLSGAWVLCPKIFLDQRGSFVKIYNSDLFTSLGLSFAPHEEYFSSSARGVIRGMHFQRPPHDHQKLVYCVSGRVLDVILDLRKNSPTYGRSTAVDLSEKNRRLFLISKGFAHGFLALEENSTMVYLTSTGHAPSHDSGVRWDSFGFAWPEENPIVSQRDGSLVPLRDLSSPFE